VKEGLPSARYLRAPRALSFPDEAEVPETKRHLKLRTLLFRILELSHADRAWIGSDQFVYYDASDPSRCLAPDLFLRMGGPDESFGSWKVWERGTPELAVEIVSDSDAPQLAWEQKLSRYHAVGVHEVVRFDPDGPKGSRLRVWDRVDNDLVERMVENDRARCQTLGLWWTACAAAGEQVALRLASDPEGNDLLPTPEEAEAKAREAEAKAREAEAKAREAEAKAREAETRLRQGAEQRVAELEAELRKLKQGG